MRQRGRDRRHRASKLPLPPGCLPTLWNADERSSAPISRLSRLLPDRPTPVTSTTDGYVYVMTRTDDIINVAGHRLSTGAMEEVLAAHPDVAECAVDRRRRCAQGPGADGFVWC